jgi:hypothetical protein
MANQKPRLGASLAFQHPNTLRAIKMTQNGPKKNPKSLSFPNF